MKSIEFQCGEYDFPPGFMTCAIGGEEYWAALWEVARRRAQAHGELPSGADQELPEGTTLAVKQDVFTFYLTLTFTSEGIDELRLRRLFADAGLLEATL